MCVKYLSVTKLCSWGWKYSREQNRCDSCPYVASILVECRSVEK